MKLAEFLIRKEVSLVLLIVFVISSLLFYEVVIITGNTFDNLPSIAFQSLTQIIFSTKEQNWVIRVLLVEFSWMVRCCPFVLTAIILNHPVIAPSLQKITNRYLAIWVLAWLGISSLGNFFLPSSVLDVTKGYTALLFALALSNSLQENSLLKNLGLCSFGIYLNHLLFVEISQSLMVRLNPSYIDNISTITLLAVSIVIFLVSWVATSLLIRNKQLSRVLV
jgi:peptidoglycan/LPS O-acetylase OafA/YrhL